MANTKIETATDTANTTFAKVTDLAKTRFSAAQNRAEKATIFARKGALAYVGLYVAAYEAAKPIFGKTEKVFGEMVVKGEAIEAQAQGVFSTATSKAAEMTSKVRETLPMPSNDRVAELEAEVEVLNKKIKAMAKKKTAAKKTATRGKTQKTADVKAA